MLKLFSVDIGWCVSLNVANLMYVVIMGVWKWCWWTGHEKTSHLRSVIHQLSGIDHAVLILNSEPSDADAPISTSKQQYTPVDCFHAVCALSVVEYHLDCSCQSSGDSTQWSVSDISHICRSLLWDICVEHHRPSASRDCKDSAAADGQANTEGSPDCQHTTSLDTQPRYERSPWVSKTLQEPALEWRSSICYCMASGPFQLSSWIWKLIQV